MMLIKTIEKYLENKLEKNMKLSVGANNRGIKLIKELALHNILNDYNITIIPTSLEIAQIAHEYNLKIGKISDGIDLAIEFADYVDPLFNFSKVNSCSLIRDKIISYFAKQVDVFVDKQNIIKKIPKISVEITKYGKESILKELDIFGKANITNKETLNKNLIVELQLNDLVALDDLDYKLKNIPGVVETGLFIQMADIIYSIDKKIEKYIDLTKIKEN